MEFAHLLPPNISSLVSDWIKEDIPSFDYGGYIVGSKQEHAVLFAKSPGILAGAPFFEAVFSSVECKVEWLLNEGGKLDLGGSSRIPVANVFGPANRLLQGERVALNILARASGIASRARRMVDIKREKGWQGIVAGTRKTTPGFRSVEKYAMIVGGADTHRMDLSSMIMLKVTYIPLDFWCQDNHIWSHGSISHAVKAAKQVGGFSLKIEVECRSLDEALEAIAAGADIIMLDNFVPSTLAPAAAQLKLKHPHILIEASGGLDESNIASYMIADIDILSCGSLSQGVPHVDFSLKIQNS